MNKKNILYIPMMIELVALAIGLFFGLLAGPVGIILCGIVFPILALPFSVATLVIIYFIRQMNKETNNNRNY